MKDASNYPTLIFDVSLVMGLCSSVCNHIVKADGLMNALPAAAFIIGAVAWKRKREISSTSTVSTLVPRYDHN